MPTRRGEVLLEGARRSRRSRKSRSTDRRRSGCAARRAKDRARRRAGSLASGAHAHVDDALVVVEDRRQRGRCGRRAPTSTATSPMRGEAEMGALADRRPQLVEARDAGHDAGGDRSRTRRHSRCRGRARCRPTGRRPRGRRSGRRPPPCRGFGQVLRCRACVGRPAAHETLAMAGR